MWEQKSRLSNFSVTWPETLPVLMWALSQSWLVLGHFLIYPAAFRAFRTTELLFIFLIQVFSSILSIRSSFSLSLLTEIRLHSPGFLSSIGMSTETPLSLDGSHLWIWQNFSKWEVHYLTFLPCIPNCAFLTSGGIWIP